MAFISDLSSEEKRLLARVDDAVDACRKRRSCFIGFLDERATSVVKQYLTSLKPPCIWRFYGGYENAERMMLGVFEDEYDACDESFPIETVAFRFRSAVTLTHRDVLGTLMGCQIARDTIGDILCTQGMAVVFVKRELADFVANHVTKIRREGVTAINPYCGVLPEARSFQDISGTVASPRLDAILKVLLSCSRERSAEYIQSMLVSVDHCVCSSASCFLKEGQMISVKGKGRFVIDDLSGVTSKGRVIVKARRYV